MDTRAVEGNTQGGGGAESPGPSSALVTFAILVGGVLLLGTLGAPRVVRVDKLGYRARVTKVRLDLKLIGLEVEKHKSRSRAYPVNLDSLLLSLRNESDEKAAEFQEHLMDPWKRSYDYTPMNGRPILRCLGRDGMPGGEGEDGDHIHEVFESSTP